jgi:hypothetical protein
MEANGLEPYISVVVAARNAHQGDVPARLRAFLKAWSDPAKQYGLPSEIVVVEWNPPADRPKLSHCLEWPMYQGLCQIRFVEVPPEVHQRYPNSYAIPLHQMLAKNVGIRRSRGEFVLATNIDTVFSAEFMQFLSERRLERRTLYRMDRHDVRSGIPTEATVDEMVAFCQKNIRRVVAAEGSFEVADDGLRRIEPSDVVGPDDGIRFGAGWFPVESSPGDATAFRWMGSTAELEFQRPAGSEPGLLMDAEVGPSAVGGALNVEVIGPDGVVRASAALEGRSKLRLAIPDEISSGSLRFRVLGNPIPLALEPRFLLLRIFRIWWERSPWTPRQVTSKTLKSGRPTSIRVRSQEPDQIQLAIEAGEGVSLDSLGVRLTDRTGNVRFQVASDRLQLPPSGQYLVAFDLGFKTSGHDDPPGCVFEGDRRTWFLEVVATRTGADWGATAHTPSRFADQMRAPAFLHTNACDDFLLLSREDWFELRGFAEFPIWPQHIDSLFCYSAYHAGLRELVLRDPLRVFHIEQERAVLTDSQGVKAITNRELTEWIEHMRRLNRPLIFTRSIWGLADEELVGATALCTSPK